MQQSAPRGQRVSAAQGESPLIAAAKRLGLWVGVGVLGVFLGSCAVGYAIVSVGGGGALAGARNVGLMVLALFYLIQVAIWSVLYFALAWLIGFYGPKLPQALRWTGGKLTTVEQVTRSGSERYHRAPPGLHGARGNPVQGPGLQRQPGGRPLYRPAAPLDAGALGLADAAEPPAWQARYPSVMPRRNAQDGAAGSTRGAHLGAGTEG